MNKQEIVTNADIKGIVVVNMLRTKLTSKIETDIKAVCNLQPNEINKSEELFNSISGRLAVANALDIISDEEYEDACRTLILLYQNQPIAPIKFGVIEQHYCKDYGFDETRVVFKVNVQERLNENFARCQTPNMVLSNFTDEDCLNANELIASFAREFELITQNEFDKIKCMIQDYRNNKKEPKEFLMVPKQFYTKLK